MAVLLAASAVKPPPSDFVSTISPANCTRLEFPLQITDPALHDRGQVRVQNCRHAALEFAVFGGDERR